VTVARKKPAKGAASKAGSPERRLYRYLETCQRREGRFPSYREIAAALGWRSTNTVSACIGRLEEAGLLKKDPGKVRSFRLLKYRRSRFLGKQVQEIEVRRAEPGRTLSTGTVWLDRGWFGGDALEAWEVTGLGPFLDGILAGDCLVVDPSKSLARGDLAAASVGEEIRVGRVALKGNSLRLRTSIDPDEELLLGEGPLAGSLLGCVVGVFRRT